MYTYPTQYANLSQSELHGLFSTANWNSLSFEQRVDACQEVENRYAAENNVNPCPIRYEPMDGGCYGYQWRGAITLNEYMLRDGQFHTIIRDENENPILDQNGNPKEVITNVQAPSWNTLDTVYHEGTHGVQEAQGRSALTYMPYKYDHDLYRIQDNEKEAYAVGQNRTLNALQEYEQKAGQLDPSRTDYLDSVRSDSFQSALQDAAKNYNDPNIDKTLAEVINNRDNDIDPVNPSKSYNAINALFDKVDQDYLASLNSKEQNANLNNENTASPEKDVQAEQTSSEESYNPSEFQASQNGTEVSLNQDSPYDGSYAPASEQTASDYDGSYSSASEQTDPDYDGSYSSASEQTDTDYDGSFSSAQEQSDETYDGSYSSASAGSSYDGGSSNDASADNGSDNGSDNGMDTD